jgi:hypothetical protein
VPEFSIQISADNEKLLVHSLTWVVDAGGREQAQRRREEAQRAGKAHEDAPGVQVLNIRKAE